MTTIIRTFFLKVQMWSCHSFHTRSFPQASYHLHSLTCSHFTPHTLFQSYVPTGRSITHCFVSLPSLESSKYSCLICAVFSLLSFPQLPPEHSTKLSFSLTFLRKPLPDSQRVLCLLCASTVLAWCLLEHSSYSPSFMCFPSNAVS